MKVLLVFLVFFFLSYSSNAQMQEEGTTVTTETTSEIQGDLEKVTTTTTTTVIENKNSGAILSSESTGIVAEKYEGDMDIDWGGQGSINSHTSCNGKLGEYTGSNTCASARLDSLTTWRQTVDLNQFSIDDGGKVRWEMRFGMEPSMYNDANKNAFVELKGYDGGSLQWTDVYNVDKSTFALSNSGTSSGNYLGPNGYIYDNLDYAGGLDSLYINIGGYGEYMFDNVWFDIYYNQIETTIAETIVYNLIEQEIQNNTSIAIPDYTYNGGGDNSNNNLPPTDVIVIDLGIEDTPPPIEDSGGDSGGIDDNLGGIDNMPTTTIEVFTNIDTSTPVVTQTTDSGAGANVDTMFNNITMDIDPEQISNIQVMVADVANTDTTMTTTNTNTDTPTVETPTTENNATSVTDVAVNNIETSNEIEPPPVNAPSESEGTNENTNTENIQEVKTETTQVESESTNEVNTDSASNKNETEVAETPNNEESSEVESNNQVTEKTETEEVQEESKEESQPEETETASGGGEEEPNEEPKEPAEEPKEEAQEEEEPKKEIAQKEEQKEEPKKEAKEEPKEESEEKQVAEKETKEEAKPEQKQTKEEKKEEQKQEKAKKIMANFDSQYDAIAQITTLALVNALGPNMSSYSQEVIVQAPTWYEPKDIYSDALIPDPLGNYFGVRDSLTFNKMIDMQYE